MLGKKRKQGAATVTVPGHTQYSGLVTAAYTMPKCLEEYEKHMDEFWDSFFKNISVDIYCRDYANAVLNGLEETAYRELERQRVERKNAMRNIVLQYQGDLLKQEEELSNIDEEVKKVKEAIEQYTDLYKKYNYW